MAAHYVAWRVCFIATAVRRSHSTCYYYYSVLTGMNVGSSQLASLDRSLRNLLRPSAGHHTTHSDNQQCHICYQNVILTIFLVFLIQRHLERLLKITIWCNAGTSVNYLQSIVTNHGNILMSLFGYKHLPHILNTSMLDIQKHFQLLNFEI